MTADASTEGTSARHCLPNAQCPMTADASTEGTSARHCLPNAQFPTQHTKTGSTIPNSAKAARRKRQESHTPQALSPPA